MTPNLVRERPIEKAAAARREWAPSTPAAGKLLWSFSPGFWLFLGVIGLRLFALLRLTGSQFLLPQAGDMQFYNAWALRILSGTWTDHSAFYGLPLYAYLLAGIYKVCGYSPFIPGFLQSACDAGTAVLLYKLSGLLFAGTGAPDRVAELTPHGLTAWRTKTIGILAAIGWALFQPAQGYSVILMPTAWLVFVFWFVVWQIVKRERAPSWRVPLSLGVLTGFTAMGIATILFLVPLVIAACFLRWAAPLRNRTLGATLFLAGVVAGASPAWMHNTFAARDPVFLSAHSGVNFWIGNNPVAAGYPKFPPGLHAGQQAMLKDSITAAEKAAGRPLKRSEVSAYWSAKASDWISRHPGDFVKLLGRKLINFWSAFRYDDISILTAFRDQSIILPGIGFGLVAAFGLCGLVIGCWRFPTSRWIAAAIFLHMASLLTVFVTERYRLAAVPGLMLFAAFGVWALWQSIATARYCQAAIFLTLLFGCTAFVSVPQKDPTLWALDTYNSGLQALEAHQLPLAQKKLDFAYAYSPHNAEINFAEGNLHLALDETAIAKRYYAVALRLDPAHTGALNNLGVLALREKHWSLASDFFRQTLTYSPDDAKLHYLLAQAELNDGHLPKAMAEIDIACSLRNGQAEFEKLRAEICKRLAPAR